jgi:hypothetical protein
MTPVGLCGVVEAAKRITSRARNPYCQSVGQQTP